MSNLSMLAALGLMRESEPPLALVVDDNNLLRLYAGGLLVDHGFEVVEADSAEAALKVMRTHNGVRLLFTDIRMPGRDGLDLAREVHARWPSVLLVITSGQMKPAPSDIPDDGRFVAKPYRAKDLFGEVDDLMRKSEL
jgi:two-component system, response regulator PdtaR